MLVMQNKDRRKNLDFSRFTCPIGTILGFQRHALGICLLFGARMCQNIAHTVILCQDTYYIL